MRLDECGGVEESEALKVGELDYDRNFTFKNLRMLTHDQARFRSIIWISYIAFYLSE